MFGSAKTNIYYCDKKLLVKAWRLTRQNYKKGIPEFIKENSNIEVWDVHYGVIGRISYGPHVPPNTSNTIQKIDCPDGSWIVQYQNGAIDCMSNEVFNMLFCEIKYDIKED